LKGFIESQNARLESLEAIVASQAAIISSLHLRDLLPSSHSPSIQSSTWPEGGLTCTSTIESRKSGLTSLLYHAGFLYSGSLDGTTRIHNASTGHLISSFSSHQLAIWSLALLHNNLYTASSDGTISVYDTQKQEIVHVIKQHTGKVYSLCIAHGRLYSASGDCTIKSWDSGWECVETFFGHSAGINNITPFGERYLASCSRDQTVRIWDLESSTCIKVVGGFQCDVLYVAYSSVRGGRLFCSTDDAKIVVYETTDWQRVGVIEGHAWEVWTLIVVGGRLFSGSFDHTVKVWDTETFEVRVLFF